MVSDCRSWLEDKHPQIIYRQPAPSENVSHPFLLSNELGHYGLAMNKTPAAGIHVGFGTNINWDIASTRDAKALVLADLSEEVMMVHKFLYETLWKIAPDPKTFIKYLRGIPLQHEAPPRLNEFGAIDYFLSLGQGSYTHEGMQDLQQALDDAVESGLISRKQANYTSSFLFDQIFAHEISALGPQLGLKQSDYGTVKDYLHNVQSGLLSFVYSPTMIRSLNPLGGLSADDEQNIYDKSFLYSFERYNKIRRLYLENKVFYAQADVNDVSFWRRVKALSSLLHLPVTDVYLWEFKKVCV